MLRVAALIVAFVLFGGRPALAIELGLDQAPAGADDVPDAQLAPKLRSLGREIGRWERKTIGHGESSLSLEIDRSRPYRLSLSERRGALHVVAGGAFVADPALFRALSGFLLGLSRYDRYGNQRVVDRLGLADRTVWKHYFGARHMAEVVFNADQGSVLAAADVVEFWQAHLDSAIEAEGSAAGGGLAALRSAQAARLAELAPAGEKARATQDRLVGRVQRRVRELRKRGIDLEKLVRADQRDSVASAIESIVPLGELEPFERAFWQRQLELMRTPPAGRRIALHRALYSGKGYQDGEVILSPMARDAVAEGKPAESSLVTYFRNRGARGKAWEGHPGILRNFRLLDKKHTSVAVNAMLANQATSSGSSPFISMADREFARDFAGRQQGQPRARVRAYSIPEDQVLIASHARWNEPEMMKFLFVFPSDRHRPGTRAPTDADVGALRSRFNRSTLGTSNSPEKTKTTSQPKTKPKARRAPRAGR
jgi:hypothetical protein